jgi:hypothetical protein
MARNPNSNVLKISDNDRIHSYLWANSPNTFQIGEEGRTLTQIPGSICREDVSYYCLSLLIRGIWKKYKIKVTGIIGGIEYEVVDGCLIEVKKYKNEFS